MSQRDYETTKDKALRLIENHRGIQTGFGTGLVIGDHDTYKVEKKGLQWSCDCKWARFRGHCRRQLCLAGLEQDCLAVACL